MGKAKRYIIERKVGRKWLGTLWTNSASQMNGGPHPVNYREAQKFLGSARRLYPQVTYRIIEAKP